MMPAIRCWSRSCPRPRQIKIFWIQTKGVQSHPFILMYLFNIILIISQFDGKKKQVCKPGSVPWERCLSFIWDRRHRRTQATYPPSRAGNPDSDGLHGFATHKVYGCRCHHPHRCALTAPFHPYPERRYFSVTLLRPHERLPVRKYGALRCPDFPLTKSATDRPAFLQN